jgi:hypothetical protein
MLVVVFVILVALCLEKRFIPSVEWYHQIYAMLGGGLGGTMTASRWVVLAVRHGEYDTRRVLWQVLTPIYSGALVLWSQSPNRPTLTGPTRTLPLHGLKMQGFVLFNLRYFR